MLHLDTAQNLDPESSSDECLKRRVSWTKRLEVAWVELKSKIPSRSSSPAPSHTTNDTESLSLPSPDPDTKGRFSVFAGEYPDIQHTVSIGSSASDSGSDADATSASSPERPRHFIPGHLRYYCFNCRARIDMRGYCGDACERACRAARGEDVSVAEGDDESVAEAIDERPPSSASNYSTDDLEPVQTITVVAPPPRPLRSPLRPSYPPVFPPNNLEVSEPSVVV